MRREERKEIMIGKETEEERKRKKRDWKRKYFRRCEFTRIGTNIKIVITIHLTILRGKIGKFFRK